MAALAWKFLGSVSPSLLFFCIFFVCPFATIVISLYRGGWRGQEDKGLNDLDYVFDSHEGGFLTLIMCLKAMNESL